MSGLIQDLTPFEFSFMHLPIKKAGDDEVLKTRTKTLNIARIVGYVPGISVIVGIARIIFFSWIAKKEEVKNADKPYVATQIVRGALEICFVFGPILLAIDLINTTRFRQTAPAA